MERTGRNLGAVRTLGGGPPFITTLGIMLRTLDTNQEFEALARGFLSQHPEIRHEWRQVRDAWGGRTDLICYPGEPYEVFASLTETQITVGTGTEETDFEDFGRGLSAVELATEAFARFKDLLSQVRHDA